MPKVSVIIPVYKVEDYLSRCVNSVLNQTFTDFELILVDDGSPDNCPKMCDEWAEKDARVRVIHQQNGGLSAARNTAIDRVMTSSDSDWITFIDSDDWIHPRYLEALLRAATENGAEMSICEFHRTEGEEAVISEADLNAVMWEPESYFVEHPANATTAWAKLYKKELFRELRYPVGKLHEDEFTTYKLLFKSPRVPVVPAQLYEYFKNEGSITSSLWTNKRLVLYEALEQQIEYFRRNGFERAMRNVAQGYLLNLTEKIKRFSKSPQKNKNELRPLKEKKRKYFKQYTKLLKLDDDNDAWVLTRIYPVRMAIYWRVKSLVDKVSKICGRKK